MRTRSASDRARHFAHDRAANAVRMTVGQNALRGSGPGKKCAFYDALSRVGWPDRRVDRLCITCCCSPHLPHHAGCPTRFLHAGKCTGETLTLILSHQG